MSQGEVHDMAPRGRLYALLLVLGLMAVSLVARAVQLQVMETEFLQTQGEARFLREVETPTLRGVITDRHGEPLAVSTPVDSVWVHPGELLQAPEQIPRLAALLGADAETIQRKLTQRAEREFVWLRRRINPEEAAAIREADIDGVFLEKEYRRFYPAGEVFAHLLGFTNIDDVGQEGLELAYDGWLRGEPGSKRVIKDRRGRIVEDVERLREPVPGKDLALTLDRRLQYLAYRELKRTVLEHGAASGSVVLLDVASGDVLALANQPSYNPNQLGTVATDALRNRAITDLFEPGSVIKPFAVAAALESGQVRPDTPMDTHPGYLSMSGYTIRDYRNYGELDITGLITKSSNVGMAKLALTLESEHLWSTYHRFGFGQVTGTGFPGESAGVLRDHHRWRTVEQATLAYGYGLSVTALQLAQAYAAIADDGRMRTPRLIQGTNNPVTSVIDPAVARQVAAMLETVTGDTGTGTKARVRHYRVAGKTGTSRKSSAGGYQSRYVSSFAGFAPASAPRLVCVVTINDPSGEAYYGGAVAGPLFSRVMTGAVRLLDLAPDDFSVLLAEVETDG